ncbi:hypothetical protein [Zoogloea sp.]|uniref:hypothetical protein n=1 Tax=Zoogloea sp. TaxID=49181 RepID=UPI0014159608|nr:MAG: hypothetical protein F9K15_12815 [Zoogloea sp.]
MTYKEIRSQIEQRKAGTLSIESQHTLETVMQSYADKHDAGTLEREEDVLLWMYTNGWDYQQADEWVAITRGEVKRGKQDDGSYID